MGDVQSVCLLVISWLPSQPCSQRYAQPPGGKKWCDKTTRVCRHTSCTPRWGAWRTRWNECRERKKLSLLSSEWRSYIEIYGLAAFFQLRWSGEGLRPQDDSQNLSQTVVQVTHITWDLPQQIMHCSFGFFQVTLYDDFTWCHTEMFSVRIKIQCKPCI